MRNSAPSTAGSAPADGLGLGAASVVRPGALEPWLAAGGAGLSCPPFAAGAGAAAPGLDWLCAWAGGTPQARLAKMANAQRTFFKLLGPSARRRAEPSTEPRASR